MRSFRQHSKSINNENLRIKTKTNNHNTVNESSNRREVLSDLTQLNENTNSKKKSSIDLIKQQSISKIQIYKQHQNQQFKKPRLEKLLSGSTSCQPAINSSTNNDETDETDGFDVVDEINKENNPPIVLDNHENSDDLLIKHHFDKLNGNHSESLDFDHETEDSKNGAYETNVVEDEDDYEDDDDDDDDINYNKPMEPKWNKSIFNELQYVMKKFSRSTLDENDEDTYDVTMVAEYAPEIFNYMHELEHRLVPDPNYMDNQDELKWEMRSVLIDWVVQVHSRFNLLPETLFLTANYIDRFLSKRKVSLSRFQLVGAVALFIAAKYEEINCPTVQEIAYMADNAYSIDDFLKAERFMIDVLEFDMGWPGPMSFLRRTSKADDYDYETRTLAKYLLEITIMDSRFVASQPSWLAAGAHYLSRKLLNRGSWTEAHVYYSGYSEAQLRPLAEVLLENCRNAEVNHKAIFEKYQERRYRRSSAFVQEYFQSLEQR